MKKSYALFFSRQQHPRLESTHGSAKIPFLSCPKNTCRKVGGCSAQKDRPKQSPTTAIQMSQKGSHTASSWQQQHLVSFSSPKRCVVGVVCRSEHFCRGGRRGGGGHLMWSQVVNEKGIEEERRRKEELWNGHGKRNRMVGPKEGRSQYPRIMNFMASCFPHGNILKIRDLQSKVLKKNFLKWRFSKTSV